jgi:putative RecB family exonuclease
MTLRELFNRLRARRARRASRPSSVSARGHSVSSCREYDLCPRRYRFAYVERLPPDRPAPEAWRYGTVVHRALEAAYRARAAGASTDVIEEAAVVALASAWKREGLADDLGGWHAHAEQLVRRTSADDVLHADDILGVEYRFDALFDSTVAFAGYADLVLRRDDRTIEIVDHKITRKIVDADALRHDQQLNLYAWLARKEWPWARRIIATHHYPPAATTTKVELTDATIVSTMRELVATARRATDDVEYIPRPGVHCDTCSWAQRCPDALKPDRYPRSAPALTEASSTT